VANLGDELMIDSKCPECDLINSSRALTRLILQGRRFEENLAALFKGKRPGIVRFCSGEEKAASGVRSDPRDNGCISSTDRGHDHAIAKSLNLGRKMVGLSRAQRRLGRRRRDCSSRHRCGKGRSIVRIGASHVVVGQSRLR
jgi:TPP-dependent pyruvate/acetoin dehydrogenase alpha subunit